MFRFVYLVIATLITRGSASYKDILPNVGFILKGYHLYNGNPLSTQVTSDPGFRASVFAANFSKNLTSSDQKFRIPNGIAAEHKVSCSTAFSRDAMMTPKQYQRLLQDMVKTNYTGFDNSFTGSSNYKIYKDVMKTSQLLITQILCSQYELHLGVATPPDLSESFIQFVKDVYSEYQSNKDDDDALNLNLHKMLNKYGTHFVTKIEMGSRYMLHNTHDENTQRALDEEGINLVSAAIFSLNKRMGRPLNEREREIANFFDNNFRDQMISSSFKHTLDGRVDPASSIPIPLYYEVERLDQLFVKRYMKKAGINYKHMGAFLSEYFENYCENEKKMGGIDVCAESSHISISERNFKIVFPEYPINSNPDTGILVREKLSQTLSAITISWWMKSPPYTKNGSKNYRRIMLSYNDGSDQLKISVADESEGGCLVIQMDGESVLAPESCLIPVDNMYHHYVFTWSNVYGSWQLYIDTNIVSAGYKVRNFQIPSGGYFMMGQNNNRGMAKENSCESFQGEIAFLNIWNYKVSGVEASRMATELSDLNGNVVSWDQNALKLTQGSRVKLKSIVSRAEFFKF